MAGDPIQTGKRWRRLPLLLSLLCLLGLVVVYNLWRVNRISIVTMSDKEVDAVLGDDLRWTAAPSVGSTIAPTVLDAFARDPVARRISAAWPDTPSFNPLRIAADIQGASGLARTVRNTIAHNSLAVATVRGKDKSSGSYRILALVFASRIRLGIARRDNAATFEGAKDGLELVSFLRRSPLALPVDLILRGGSCEVVMGAVQDAAASGLLRPDQILELYRKIEPAPEKDESLAHALQNSFATDLVPSFREFASEFGARALFSGFEDGEHDLSGLVSGEFDLPATVLKAAQLQRVTIANCFRPWTNQDSAADAELKAMTNNFPAIPEIEVSDGWLAKTWLRTKFKSKMQSLPNSLGIIALTTLMPDEQQMVTASVERRTIFEAHRLNLLFDAYRLMHGGALPSDLADLQQIAGSGAFPQDLFAAGPFHYSRDRRIFWSVGLNGKDDGGVGGRSRSISKDIVWQLR